MNRASKKTNQRLWFCALCLVLLVASNVSCSSGGSSDPEPELQCNALPASTDAVSLQCGGALDRFTELVLVVIGGPTSADIQGFNFDLVYDPSRIRYVAGSAEQGSLLSQDGDDPLLAVELDNGMQGRLIVGIHRTNQPQGVQGLGSQIEVLSLAFEATDHGTEFGPVPISFENAEVVDSVGTIGVAFDDGLSLAFQ